MRWASECSTWAANTARPTIQRAAERADLLRDIFGPLPFLPHPPPDLAWLSWNSATVVSLAQGIYEERAFDRLPVLGDALEDAGCQDAEVLGHCRAGGEHTRGCWVVDLVLGKA